MPDNPNQPLIRIAGRKAPDDMPAGKHLARCIRAEVKRRGSQTRAVLTFRVEDGKFDGVLLTAWLAIFENVAAHHKFARAYQIAVARELQVDEEVSLNEFVDKLYIVDVGYRTTDGKKFTPQNCREKKDDKDFLRVHDILSLADSATAVRDDANTDEQRTHTRARRVVKLPPRRGQS